MKHLFTLLLMAITFTGLAQISPPAVPKSGTKQATTNQAYIYRSGTGDTTRLYLRLGASGISADYYEISNSGGGGIAIDTNRLMYLDKNQNVTGYKSFVGRAAVSNTASSGSVVFDVTSIGAGTGLIVTNAGGGHAAQFITTTGYAGDFQNVSSSLPAVFARNLSTGDHAQFGSASGKIATFVNSGNLITPKASASNHVVIKSQLDSVGALVSGGVTSVSAGYGTNFTTITSTGSVVVDTTEIASKNYVDTLIKYRTNNILKDFYTDSSAVGTTFTDVYRCLLDSGKLARNGDKIIYTAFLNQSGSTFPTFDIRINNLNVTSYTFDPTTIQNIKLQMTIFRTAPDSIRVSVEIDGRTFGSAYDIMVDLADNVLLGLNIYKMSGALTAKSGYVEFKPAAL